MIADKKLLFCNNQAFGNTGTTYSDVVDLSVDRDVGIGRPIEIDMRVTEAGVASSTDGTLTLILQTSDTEAFSEVTELARTTAIAEAALVIGYEPARWRIPSPTKRYLRIALTVANQNFSAGKLWAAAVVDRQADRAYPSGLPTQAW